MRVAPFGKTAALGLVGALACFGYIRSLTAVADDKTPAPLFRTDNTGIQFVLNDRVVPGMQSSLSGKSVTVMSATSNPVAAMRASLASWNAVSTANIKFLPLKVAATGIDGMDNTHVIAVAASNEELSFVGGPAGALAVTLNTYNPIDQPINGVDTKKGAIFDSDIIVNPAYAFSTDGSTPVDFQSIMTHETGHALGSSHTSLVGANMFWTNNNQRFLSSDEVTLMSIIYPKPGAVLATGTVNGTVTAGGKPVAYSMISMIDVATGISAGTLTAEDGTYSVLVPPGSYQIIAEPLTGVVRPGNLYLNATQAALATSIAYQATLGPAPTAVSAGGTATANIAVNTGTSTLAPPIMAAGAVNGSVGVAFTGGPATIQSGQQVDLILDGAGYDATLKESDVKVLGPGLSIKAGSLRADPKFLFGGVPILRITLDIAPTASQFLASIFITKGTSTYSLTGALIVTPPAPSFTSKSLVSAASYVGVAGDGAVSPGGIYSLYAAPNTLALGPATPVGNAGFDPYSLLATTLAGVNVTFDGVPAPLFFVYGGQINLQVPFEVAGKKTTQVVVNYLGAVNAAVTVPVVPVQPAFFTVTPLGADSILTNQDGKLNTAANPEARGNYVTAYGTGLGKLGCPAVTGAGAPGGCTAGYTVTIGSQTARGEFFFAGWTPTLVGLSQWTFQIPANAPTGAQTLTATETASGVSTPKGTIYIK